MSTDVHPGHRSLTHSRTHKLILTMLRMFLVADCVVADGVAVVDDLSVDETVIASGQYGCCAIGGWL